LRTAVAGVCTLCLGTGERYARDQARGIRALGTDGRACFTGRGATARVVVPHIVGWTSGATWYRDARFVHTERRVEKIYTDAARLPARGIIGRVRVILQLKVV